MPEAATVASEILSKVGRLAPIAGLAFTVSTLLAQSKAAHLQYRQAIVNKDTNAQAEMILMAARYRAQAQELDPTHRDAGWQDAASMHQFSQISHGEIHDDLLEFYLKELNK